MRVLVTGVAGFIGSHLGARLLDGGHEVVGLDSFDETLYPAELHARNLETIGSHRRFEFVHGDLLDAPLVDGTLAQGRFDVVVHLAALAGVRPSIAQPKRYQRVNVEGTLNVLEACRAAGVARLVFASSSSVYGARSEVPFREDDAADRPASPYAATKRAGELFCANWSELWGIATTALRFFTVYGPRQRPEMAIHKFARLILDGKPLPLFGDGSTARDYTFIDDIIDGVVAAIDVTEGGRHRVYNLGGSRTTTLARLVELLEQHLGRRALVEKTAEQPGDVPITCASVERAARELGYAPKIPVEEGIARFCAWIKAESGA
ncbi:MAG TPA: NAD-dependent epimerase/dehydratase family protein [Polyangia bacterium]|nr:NAD-dependent epimerase/dehydratase family protein [Polyangia bacterium]